MPTEHVSGNPDGGSPCFTQIAVSDGVVYGLSAHGVVYRYHTSGMRGGACWFPLSKTWSIDVWEG